MTVSAYAGLSHDSRALALQTVENGRLPQDDPRRLDARCSNGRRHAVTLASAATSAAPASFILTFASRIVF